MELRKISEEELAEMLREHKKWLDSNGEKGKRADLSYTDLRKTNLSAANLFKVYLFRADLSRANLSGANLLGIDLHRANLFKANLSRANLSGANLPGVNLSGADLSGADLFRTNLFRANLSGANLLEAGLFRANLFAADLIGTNLGYANISGANFYNAELNGAKLDGIKYDDTTQYFALQCPEKGEFVAYKKAYDSELRLPRIVKLLIPADALRSSATTEKCRCNKAKVLSITSLDDKRKYQKASSRYDATFIYEVGETVEVSDFDKDRWKECAPGIHFFMRRMDAVNY